MFSNFKPNHLSTPKKTVLILILFYVWTFFVYTFFFATNGELRTMGAYQIDKTAHILAGVLIAGACEWLFLNRASRGTAKLMVILLAIAVSWEVFEFMFPDTRAFYALAPDLWRLDTIGDIVGASLGGYGYWVFAASREEKSNNKNKFYGE